MLESCVGSLLAQKTNIPFEIVVLDQSSPRFGGVPRSKKPPVRVIACDFKNKSRALNMGVNSASADLLAVIDDDCLADEGWIDSIYGALRSKEGSHSVVTGRVIAGDKENGSSVRSRLNDVSDARKVFEKGAVTPIFKLSGCNFGFDREVYDEVGPFNERLGPGSPFKSSDDNEWQYRFSSSGIRLVYEPEAVVVHRSWRNAEEDASLLGDYGYAAGAFFKAIYENSKLDFFCHGIGLWWWLLKNIFFSFDLHEIGAHIRYGLAFWLGFLDYRVNPGKTFDYVFVLSPGKYIGGAERYVQNMAKELERKGSSNFVIAISHNFRFYSECKKSFRALYLGDTLGKASAELASFLKKNGAGAVVSNGYHSLFLVSISRLMNAFRSKESLFVDIKHGWIDNGPSDRFITVLDKLASVFPDVVVLVNPSMKKDLWFVNERKIVHIPSGVEIPENSVRKGPKRASLKILLVGRLAEEKRFDSVIRALISIRNRPWELTVVGDGPKLEDLRRLSARGGLGDRIRFTGYREDTGSFYEDADLLIISSASEGLPLVALEAMVRGVLVLSTRVGYMPELLANGRGFLLDAGAADEKLADKITEVSDLDDGTKMEVLRRAKRFVSENHDIRRSTETFEDVLKAVRRASN
jgi:hypothetical protein